MARPEDRIKEYASEPVQLPGGREECDRVLLEHAEHLEVIGVKDPNVLTCGYCALVCGPTIEDTRRRFYAPVEGGIVVPGDRTCEMRRAAGFDEAKVATGSQRPWAIREEIVKDSMASALLWHMDYSGLRSDPAARAHKYRWKLMRAAAMATRGQRRKDGAGG